MSVSPDSARPDHAARLAAIRARLDETSARFVARLEAAADVVPPAGAWNAAQIAVHVARVNENLAAVISGRMAVATPPPPGFAERDWNDIGRAIPERIAAPARFVPPADAELATAVQMLRDSVLALQTAVAELTPERAGYCITNRAAGTLTLYQAGEFAASHMVRHNQQVKRLLATDQAIG